MMAAWTPIVDAALVLSLGAALWAWSICHRRRERRLSDRAVDRLRRDFETNPLGGEVTRR